MCMHLYDVITIVCDRALVIPHDETMIKNIRINYWEKILAYTVAADLDSQSEHQPANGIVSFNSSLSAKISLLGELRVKSCRSNCTCSLWWGSQEEKRYFVHDNTTNDTGMNTDIIILLLQQQLDKTIC